MKNDELLTFKQFISEENLFESKTKGVTPGNAADSIGKIAEGLTAQHLNGGEGKHPEDYRLEGKKPRDVHVAHSTFVFGKDYRKNASYQAMSKGIGRAANATRSYINKKYGINKISRVAATSQTSEHKKETGLEDPHFKGDVVVTGQHSGDHTKGKKVAISIKMYDYSKKKKSTNWANHGMKTLSAFSGKDFQGHRDEHQKTLSKFKIPKGESDRKNWYKSLNPKHKQTIDDSYRNMQAGVASSYAKGLAETHHHKDQNVQDSNLKKFVAKSVGAAGQKNGGDFLEGKTHLPHVMLKLKKGKDGEISHHIADIPEHISNYLSHFDNLHVHHGPTQSSVSIMGRHKGTGKTMTVHRTAIYGGGTGASTQTSFRTSTQLPSEEHKDVNTFKPFKK